MKYLSNDNLMKILFLKNVFSFLILNFLLKTQYLKLIESAEKYFCFFILLITKQKKNYLIFFFSFVFFVNGKIINKQNKMKS